MNIIHHQPHLSIHTLFYFITFKLSNKWHVKFGVQKYSRIIASFLTLFYITTSFNNKKTIAAHFYFLLAVVLGKLNGNQSNLEENLESVQDQAYCCASDYFLKLLIMECAYFHICSAYHWIVLSMVKQ